jgi:hypothetical protein
MPGTTVGAHAATGLGTAESPIDARSLYERAGEPKRLRFLAGTGHTEWMFDDSLAFSRVIGWLDEYLSASLVRAGTGA